MSATGYTSGDPRKVSKSGDTMTGALVLPGNPTEPLQAADMAWVEEEVAGGGGGGAVSSVFGRTGAVAAQSGDYTAAQVGADSAGAAATAQANAETFATGAVATETTNRNTAIAAAVAPLAPLASPALTGNPTAPTQTTGDSSTKVATDQFVATALALAPLKANNLSDLLSASTARTNLGLGGAATENVGTTSGTVAAGNDGRITGALQAANNLSDVANPTTARGNLAAAPLASPSFSGTPTVPTASPLTSNTQAASTAYADLAVGVETTNRTNATALLAPLASPTFTGVPAAPTAAPLTNNTQVATTQYADLAVGVEQTRALAAEALRQITAPAPQINRGKATVVTTYASGHGWTASGFATSNVNDTSDGRLSGQMLTGTTTGNIGVFPSFTKTGATALNITGQCLRVWIKVDVPTNVDAITLRVAGTGGIAGGNYLSWTALAASSGTYRTNGVMLPPNTWTELSFSLGSAFTTGSPTPTAITEYRWICQDLGTAFTAHFGGIEAYPALSGRWPNGVVCIGFDDCYAGQFNLAMNLMSSFGYTATIFPIIDQIGGGGSFTLAQLQQMVNIGWEVAPHASTLANHTGWNSLTTAQVAADVEASRAWISGQGFGLSGMFAYPLGGFNGGFSAAVAPLCQVARTIDSTMYTESLPIGNELQLRSAAGIGGTGGIGIATYTAATTGVLALAKAAGALVPMTIHDVSSGTSGNINQISIADLTTLVTAINTAGMAVATYGEVLEYAMLGAQPAAPLTAGNSTITISGPANAQTAVVSPSVALTGTPTAPTGTPGDSSTQIATDAFVAAVVALLAPLASPSLTGTPTAPTATPLTSNTQLATTAYADSAVSVEKVRALAAEALLAPLASPTLTGVPAAPTAAAYLNTTQIATTAYVTASTPTLDMLAANAIGAVCATMDPTNGAATPGITLSRPYFCRVHIAAGVTISSFDIDIITASSGNLCTAAYLGLYTATAGLAGGDTLLGVTANFSATVNAATAGALTKVALSPTTPIGPYAVGAAYYLSVLMASTGTVTVVGGRQYGTNQSAASGSGRLFVNLSGSTMTTLPGTTPALVQTASYSLPYIGAYN
jgi:peptidoglycan/xylan/chitin deacetylase (PgdA/CDA1 family)